MLPLFPATGYAGHIAIIQGIMRIYDEAMTRPIDARYAE
jgi:hypothetical protein